MRQNDPNFKLRMPGEVHDYLKRKSQQQERTMSAHIVFLLRQDMKNEKASDAALESTSDASHQ